MSMTDPISDFLARLRNGIRARKREVACPRSNLKLRIAEILREEGFLDGVATAEDTKQGSITVTLRYDGRASNAITGLRRVSRPGQRKYVPSQQVPRVRNGLGIAIISTSLGIMTDREARKRGVGGEVLCEVW
ncbi:MAG: 30S ribosomal protein S8 [Myxococcales bacterium]|nr:30S ribosomal protein S8 [Myxococcales bacterium]